MTRIYDIKLSCGCLYSSYGDWCIPCFSDNCKCKEEYYDKYYKDEDDKKSNKVSSTKKIKKKELEQNNLKKKMGKTLEKLKQEVNKK